MISGKTSAIDSQTKQIILTTETSFPACRTVLKVISKKTSSQTVIESDIEEIEKQSWKINEKKERSRKDLLLLLNGCLILRVNQRPVEIVEEYAKQLGQFPNIYVIKLYQAILSWLDALKKAISIHLEACLEPDQVRTNKTFSKSFKSLRKRIDYPLQLMKQVQSKSEKGEQAFKQGE